MQPNTYPNFFFWIISTLVLDALGVLTPNDAAGPYTGASCPNGETKLCVVIGYVFKGRKEM